MEARIEEAIRVRGLWPLLRGVGRRETSVMPGAGHAGLETPGIARVMLDAFNITQDRNSRARLAMDPPDVAVARCLEGMGLFEFHRAAKGIALGREAALAVVPQIRRLTTEAAPA